ncbi:MAG: alpha/beta hydrolase [Myxococcales bacterium]
MPSLRPYRGGAALSLVARITRFVVRHLLRRWVFGADIAMMRRRERPTRLPRSAVVKRVDAGGVSALSIEPGGATDRTLLYLHGGGFVFCSPGTHQRLACAIAAAAGARALLPAYRLAPEHPFPAGLDDCVAAYRWLLAQGTPPHQIVVAGDSAGGNLTLATLLTLRDAGDPLPAAAIALSPATDFTFPVEPEALRREAFLDPRFLLEVPGWYLGAADANSPRASPAKGDLRGLPPLLLHVGSEELLLDDNRRFAELARAAGVDVTMKVWDGLWHVFQIFDFVPEAKRAIAEIGAFVRGH